MLKSYLKIALRHLLRHKSYSIINILGLAVGVACCVLILLFVQDELGYDSWTDKSDQIYRMALERNYPGRSTSYAIIPHSYAETVKDEFPEVEDATRLLSFPGSLVLKVDGEVYEEENAVWADSNFFEIFTLPLLRGEVKNVLNKPNTVVLTEATAKRYFNDTDPIGKVLDIPNNDNDLVVTGVCANVPPNTHFKFDMVRSASSMNFLEQENYISFAAYTYFVLNKNADPKQVEAKMPDLVTKYASGPVQRQFGVSYEEYQKAGNGYRYFLQPLQEIYLSSRLEAELKPPGSKNRVYIFTVIALFILLIACINFMNLSTARSAERAKEVGIRKTLGSLKGQIAGQFLLEAGLISLIGTVLAIGLLYFMIPIFNDITGKALNFGQVISWTSIPMFLLFALIVGVVAGSYPAMVLSSFKPIAVLRGKLLSTSHGINLRNGLVVFQFMISVILIIGTIVVYNQLRFMQTKELGFNEEHVVTVKGAFALQNQTETFKNQVLDLASVKSVGGCNAMPGGQFFGVSFRKEGENEAVTGRGLIVDEDYMDCMQMEMMQGRAYSKDFQDSLSVVLNEAAVNELGYDDPVGKRLTSPDNFLNPEEGQTSMFTIVGVVKDFHFQSLHQEIEPLFFVHNKFSQRTSGIISVRIQPPDFPATISQIEQIWMQFVPDQPFRFSFFDSDLNMLYQAEQTAQKVFGLFAVLAIFIACMGVLGLAAYITQQRTKEIGIRKVLGASAFNIVTLLSKDFLKLVLVALVIASPIAWYAANSWLEDFAYRIDVSWWIFILAGVLAIVITLLTVSFQTVKAALLNPVKTLKYE